MTQADAGGDDASADRVKLSEIVGMVGFMCLPMFRGWTSVGATRQSACGYVTTVR